MWLNDTTSKVFLRVLEKLCERSDSFNAVEVVTTTEGVLSLKVADIVKVSAMETDKDINTYLMENGIVVDLLTNGTDVVYSVTNYTSLYRPQGLQDSPRQKNDAWLEEKWLNKVAMNEIRDYRVEGFCSLKPELYIGSLLDGLDDAVQLFVANKHSLPILPEYIKSKFKGRDLHFFTKSELGNVTEYLKRYVKARVQDKQQVNLTTFKANGVTGLIDVEVYITDAAAKGVKQQKGTVQMLTRYSAEIVNGYNHSITQEYHSKKHGVFFIHSIMTNAFEV